MQAPRHDIVGTRHSHDHETYQIQPNSERLTERSAVLSEMSQEELAIVANPGMAPRRHLDPR